ncbi:MAG: hypothetical protein QXR30_02355 [Candidatus Woesearchaeota archaeon]
MEIDILMDSFENTASELKRAEHSIYVSLKYTRTQDVLENIIERLTNTLSNLIEFLVLLKSEEPFPKNKKLDLFKEMYPDEIGKEILKYYNLLKVIKKRRKTVINQYRRHIKLVVELEPMIFYIVDLDSVEENYKLIKGFVDYAHKLFLETKREELNNINLI